MVSIFVEFVKGLERRDNVRVVDVGELAAHARPIGRPTSQGGLSFFSVVRSRSASQSVIVGSDRVREKRPNMGQQAILGKLESTLQHVQEYLEIAPFLCVKRTIGANGFFNPKCVLYLSAQRPDKVRQAYLWAMTLAPYASELPGHELYLVSIPEWPEHNRQVLVFPEERLTLVLGMDYVGEVKMGFLRKAMWEAKAEGMLSLHTRRMTVLPIVSKLSPEQAAATFMLGESIETSAGDPRRAGESVRVVGTDPFLIGEEATEGNWLYDFLQGHAEKAHCYLLNTGGIGEIVEHDVEGKSLVVRRALRVAIDEMAAIIRGIARNTIRWEQGPYFATLVPSAVDGVDIDKFRLDRLYTQEQASAYTRSLKQERQEWLAGFPGLRKEIVEALTGP